MRRDFIWKLKKLSKDIHVDYSDLLESYNDLDVYNGDKVDAASNILKAATRYIWLSEYIDIGYDTLASNIDDYIKVNLTKNISIHSICSEFKISKNN